MRESRSVWRAGFLRGQSIVELAMMTPLLLILLSGVFEFGFLFANYLAVADATRNAARFSSDSQYDLRDSITACTGVGATTDFYRQTACLAIAELENQQPTLALCLPNSAADRHCPRAWDLFDDVIISVFSITRNDGGSIDMERFPDMGANTELGWSYAVDLDPPGDQTDPAKRTGMHSSNYSNAIMTGMLNTPVGIPPYPLAPSNANTGFIVVEICFHYYQILALPWFTEFIEDPIPIRFRAVWTLSSAEPTSTPRP